MSFLRTGARVTLGASFIALPRHQRLIGGLLAAFYVVIVPGLAAAQTSGPGAA